MKNVVEITEKELNIDINIESVGKDEVYFSNVPKCYFNDVVEIIKNNTKYSLIVMKPDHKLPSQCKIKVTL